MVHFATFNLRRRRLNGGVTPYAVLHVIDALRARVVLADPQFLLSAKGYSSQEKEGWRKTIFHNL